MLIFVLIITMATNVCSQNIENDIRTSFHAISSNDLLNDATELSSPKYAGRLSGSPGYMAAAQWIADQLKLVGIKPGCAEDSYFQFFPNAYSEIYSAGSLKLISGFNRTIKSYHFPEDYFPGSNSASGTISGELVYVGFGITAPELGYDDYKNIDVKGKILIMETGVPYSANDSTQLKWEPYSYHRYKFQHAKELGASGLLYVSKIANPNTSYLNGFIYAHISEVVAEELFEGSGFKYAEIHNIISKNQHPNSLPLSKKVRISASSKYFPDAKSCNVIGIIEGTDPELKKEAIIIGAHLDAVGSPGTLFPGALDNASGCIDILAAARALATSKVRPSRSIIFIFFGGEECGLYGSKKYVEAPVWEKNKILCMINLDMVGNGTGFMLSNGKTHTEILDYFLAANDKYLHRDFNSTLSRVSFSRPRTDGAIFEKAGYKNLNLYTSGTVKTVYYHHPLDNTDALTPEIMEDAAKLLYISILNLANDKKFGKNQKTE
jgi:hypothetical protein